MDVKTIADYLRLTDDSEIGILTEIANAADLYLLRVTGKTKVVIGVNTKPINDDPLYQQALFRLTAHWFENRSAESETPVHKLEFSLQQLINIITLSSEYI